MSDHLYAVIMAGGIGTRLWPRSRTAVPKQFLDLLGPRTMLQDTVDRIEPLIPLSRMLVVVSSKHAEVVRRQVPGLPQENIIVEPGPRGTAPCIALAAVAIQQRDEQATMAVFPADHRVADAEGFRTAIAASSDVAQDDYLVTLGITPNHPHTGYGYIERGESLGSARGMPAYRVLRFTEKPDVDTARLFVECGQYYWNGGIFIWKVATILNEMARLLPRLHAELQPLAAAWGTEGLEKVIEGAWGRVPRTTIDYGIMEKATRAAVVPVDIGWDDVGNWATLSDLVGGDAAGNTTRGEGRHFLIDTTDTYVYSSEGRLAVVVGLVGLVVVDTPEALLICTKEDAQRVREVVERLREEGLQEFL